MQVLDRTSRLPLYYQLREHLRQQILSGAFSAGALLPSEQELMAQHGVSRITVRQALSDLRRDGLVTRHSGRGTFVAKPKIADLSQRIGGVMENLRALGYEPSSEILSLKTLPATADLRSRLDVVPGEAVFEFERLIRANGEPIAISRVVFTAPRDLQISRETLAQRSLIPIVWERAGIRLVRAERTIEAGAAPTKIARSLGIRRGSPLLVTESTIYDAQDRRRVAIRAAYRGDRYKYFISLPTLGG